MMLFFCWLVFLLWGVDFFDLVGEFVEVFGDGAELFGVGGKADRGGVGDLIQVVPVVVFVAGFCGDEDDFRLGLKLFLFAVVEVE